MFEVLMRFSRLYFGVSILEHRNPISMCSFAGAHHYELWTTWVAHQGGPLSPSSCGGQNETMKPEPKPEIWNDLDTVLVMFWEEYLEIDQNQRDVAKSVVHWFCMLVGGLEHEFYFPINIGNLIIPIDSYFSEGWPNHQPVMDWQCC